MVWVLGKDVFDDLKLLENEIELKTTLTLTQIANPHLACVQNAEIVIFTVSLGLRCN